MPSDRRNHERRGERRGARREKSRDGSTDGRTAVAVGAGLVGSALLAGAVYAGRWYGERQSQRTEQENTYRSSPGRGYSGPQRFLENDSESYFNDQSHNHSQGNYDAGDNYLRLQSRDRPSNSRRSTGRSSRSGWSTSSTVHPNHTDEFEIEEIDDTGLEETTTSTHTPVPTPESQAIVPFTEAPQPQVATPAIRIDPVESSIPPAPPQWQRDPVSGSYFYDNQDGTLRTWADRTTTQLRPPAPEPAPEWTWDERYMDYYYYDSQRKGWQYLNGQFIAKADP
ncbi:hypothetical protein NX059_010510 [Plenodomus lindquistii]|nr:hypothetical protein NX059_010510 [Plenodomus lindquistii]